MTTVRKTVRPDAPLLSLLLGVAVLVAIPLVMFLMLVLWGDSVARQLVAGAGILVLVFFALKREKYYALLFGVVFFSQFAISLHSIELTPPALFQLFILDLIVALLVWVALEKGIRWKFDKVAWLFAGLILWQFVATAYSAHMDRSLIFIAWQIKFLVVYVIVRNVPLNERIAAHLYAATFFAVSLQGIIAILQYVTGGLLGLKILGEPDANSLYFVDGGLRVFGTLGGTNSLAGYLAMCLVFLLPHLIARRYLTTYAAAGLGSVALLLTFSRAGWLSLILGGAAVILLLVRQRKMRLTRVMSATLIAAVFLGIFSAIFIDRITERFQSRQAVASAQTRVTFAYQAWEVIKDYPIFGIGPGVTEYFGRWNDNAKYVRDALPNVELENQVHNGQLQVWMESGTPAFFMWLMIVALAVVTLFSRQASVRHDQMVNMLRLGAAAAAVAILIHITFGTEINNFRIMMVFWVLLAVARNEAAEATGAESAPAGKKRKQA